jgi:hypothetical protein
MLAVGAIVTLLYGAQLNESYLNWINGIGNRSQFGASEAEVSGGVPRSQPVENRDNGNQNAAAIVILTVLNFY